MNLGGRRKKMNHRSKGERPVSMSRAIVIRIFLIIVVLWAIVPVLWAIGLSFKSEKDIWTLSVIPFVQYKPVLDNWIQEMTVRGAVIGKALKNSMIIALGATAFSLVLGSLAGYGLARFKYGKIKNESIATFFLSQRIIPPVVVIVPYFFIMKGLGLVDSVWSLIIINTIFVLPFPILISRAAFKELPIEIEESAYIDGCSHLRTFFKISLPLIAPQLVAAALICLTFTWNEFLYAFTLTYENAAPITVTLAGTETWEGVQFHYIATRLLIMIGPPLAIAIMLQKYLVQGLTFGAVKG